MNDKGKPIKQTPDQTYPEPKLPADNAWSTMEGMLNQQMPLSNKTTFNFVKTIKLLTITTLTASGLLYFLFYDTENPQKKLVGGAVKSTRSMPVSDKNAADSIQNIGKHKTAGSSEDIAIEKTAAPSDPTRDDAVNTRYNKTSIELSKIEQNNPSPKNTVKIGNATTKKQSELPSVTSPNVALHLRSSKNASNTTSPAKTVRSDKPLAFSDKGQLKPSNDAQVGTRQPATGNKILKNRTNNINYHLTDGGTNGEMAPTSQKPNLADGKDVMVTPIENNNVPLILRERPFRISNKLKGITIQATPANSTKKKTISGSLLRNIHAGLLWNVNVPFAGYDAYFKGADSTSDFYKILLPGLWVGKTFNNGNELILKARAYNPCFGGKRPFSTVDSLRRYFLPARDTLPARDSVVNYHHSTYLVKSSGFNVGMQYNQRINSRWALGAGANLQFQKSAVVRYSNIVSDSTKTISSIGNFDSVTPKSDSPKYFNTFFITSNVEVLYSWKKLQLGAGLVVPVTSIIASPYRNLRPVSGQVTVRWWVK